MAKRSLDVLLSILLLLALLPILVLVAVGVRLAMGAPVLFVQERAGRGGKAFKIIKFRTMKGMPDATGERSDAARLTRFGRWLRATSLDELPELLNVLKGDMSLVGPRPLLMDYLPLYDGRQAKRHEVRPGITGWAQIHGRNAVSWEERLELDAWYVENRSLLLDLRILLATIGAVVKRKGIAQRGHATMERFKGRSEAEPK